MIIGIVIAMENEIEPFLTYFTRHKKKTLYKKQFYTCAYREHTLILVCSGRGKVNATVYTQQLITVYNPDIIFNIGVSGGLEANSKIFDIYVGSKYCHYDVRRKQSESTFPHKLYYEGDIPTIETLLTLNVSVKPGIFGTGEGFIANTEQKEFLRNEFDLSAVDMESAAIAQCCYLNEVRFLAIRGICDNADEQAVYTGEDLQKQISFNIMQLFLQLLVKI